MADPGLKMELVTRDFNRMIEELAAIDPRIEFETVLKSEAGSVVARSLGRTKSARVNKILAYYASRKFITMDGKIYRIDYNRFPDAVWERMLDMSKQAREIALDARGLAKQSWLHIGRSLGTPIKAPGYVSKANFKGQQYPQNGTSMTAGTGTSATVTIENALPYNSKIGSSWVFLGAMSARARYFERNMTHYAFRSLETRAKKYPGIFASPPPPPAGFDFNAPDS